MFNVSSLVEMLVFVYGASCLGTGAAFAIRAVLRSGKRNLSALEAFICVSMPLIALSAFLTTSAIQPERFNVLPGLHQTWHVWIERIRFTSLVHAGLHIVHWGVLIYAIVGFTRLLKLLVEMRLMMSRVKSLPGKPFLWGETTIFTLDTARPLCFTLGIFHPRVYVSTGLLEQLTPQERDAMFAHETAHIRRRDGVWNLLFIAFYRLIPLPGGMLLYRDWQRAEERACDAEAAKCVGNPYDVASALVEAARIINRQSAPGAIGFTTGDDIESRVQSLLSAPFVLQTKGTVATIGIAGSVTIFVLTETWLHHFVQLLIQH